MDCTDDTGTHGLMVSVKIRKIRVIRVQRCNKSAFIGVMPAVMHRHVCLRAYVDAPSRGATRGVHLRFLNFRNRCPQKWLFSILQPSCILYFDPPFPSTIPDLPLHRAPPGASFSKKDQLRLTLR